MRDVSYAIIFFFTVGLAMVITSYGMGYRGQCDELFQNLRVETWEPKGLTALMYDQEVALTNVGYVTLRFIFNHQEVVLRPGEKFPLSEIKGGDEVVVYSDCLPFMQPPVWRANAPAAKETR